jgi:hypothetical protein
VQVDGQRSFTERADAWSLAHPWLWGGAIGAVVLVANLVTGLQAVVAVAVGLAVFGVSGWSMSRGRVRRATERRLHRSFDAP